MNILSERREVSNRWDIYLYPKIHKNVEEIIEDNRCLRVGWYDLNTYEVVDEHNNVVNLHAQKCSCRRSKVHGLPYKHACTPIIQMDTSVHCYIDDYFTADCYRHAYAEPIYPITNNDKLCDDHHELRMHPPISKKCLHRPSRKRIEL